MANQSFILYTESIFRNGYYFIKIEITTIKDIKIIKINCFMLSHLVHRNTHQFYELYYMLWNRAIGNNKFMVLLKNHYYSMFLLMEYIKYTDICGHVVKNYFRREYSSEKIIYEENI